MSLKARFWSTSRKVDRGNGGTPSRHAVSLECQNETSLHPISPIDEGRARIPYREPRDAIPFAGRSKQSRPLAFSVAGLGLARCG